MQIDSIPLFHADFWVQIHNLPAGFMKETVGVKLGNYIGTFMEYDKNNNSSFWRQHMRVRVKVDVRQPLKRDSKVRDKQGAWCTVNFKYEKLGIFCFVCGIMGHAENKCEVRFAMENDDGRREWSGELRADHRRGGGKQTSRWLREERNGGDGMFGGDRMNQARSTVEIPSTGPTSADMAATASGTSRPIPTTLITNNSQFMMRNGQPSSYGETVTNNHISLSHIEPQTDIINSTSRHPSLVSVTDANQQLLPKPFNSNLVTEMPQIYCQSTSTQNLSLIPHKPLLSNNCLVFNSQPQQTIPLKTNNRTQLNAHHTQPTKKPNRPDPHMTRILLNSDPTEPVQSLNPNPTEPVLTMNRPGLEIQTPTLNRDNAVAMEFQTEKKRRRQEKNQPEKNDEQLTHHFLSAGPGSQDCREQ
jgi:14-3-3 protein epsilon